MNDRDRIDLWKDFSMREVYGLKVGLIQGMKSIDFIDQALNIFRQDIYTTERYSSEINWFLRRREKWNSDKIRIGVLGVTSSGKSTLINAVLGDKLLSMAVKPSSSQLVSCFKGLNPEAEIYFEDGRPKLQLKGKSLNPDNIKKYSDESVNKGNKERVTDILLKTPRFDLGENVVLIDSAGLDAYKLETHEKLSLEVLLPTIDLCIFVTTLKTNSDAKTRSVLNAIARHKCPLLIVQNMLDSVESSADGSKTKEMVAAEHKKRLQRIVDNSQIEDKNSVKIIQVSAIYAMRERCENQPDNQKRSKYNTFIATLLSMVKTHLPHVEEGRMLSSCSYLHDLIDQEKKSLSGIPVKIDSFQYEESARKLELRTGQTLNNLQGIVDKIGQLHTALEKGAQRNIKESIQESKHIIRQCEEQILKIIARFNDDLHHIAEKLNYPLRDLSTFQRINNIAEPKERTKTVTYNRKVKKDGISGFLGRVKGFFTGDDDSGYEYESYTEIEFDEVATERELLNYVIRVEKAYASAIMQWQKTTERTVDQLQDEIDMLYESYLRLQKEIKQTEAVRQVIDHLEDLLHKSKPQSPDQLKIPTIPKNTSPEMISKLKNIRLTPYQYGLLNSARLLHRQIYQRTLQQCQEAVKAPLNSVVIGWDIDSMESFSIRFLNISPNTTELGLKNKITVDRTTYIFSPDPQYITKMLPNIEKSIFVLVNAHQDGSAKNQISSLELAKHILPQDRVFWVVQEIDSLVECDGLSEMRTNFADYYQEFRLEKQRGLILINDDNPIFNLAFCQNQLNSCKKHTEEIELISLLKEHMGFLMNNRAEKVVGDLIRSVEGSRGA